MEREIGRFATQIAATLGERLVGVALYGSAAGDDFVPARSDVNVAVVVERVTTEVLEALAPIVARWRTQGFALPLLVDPDWLARARDVFPMELEDIRRQHRVIAGRDVFAALRTEPGALRAECEREARGKLLRLRAHYLEDAARPAALEALLLGSLKSFLVILRHLLTLAGTPVDGGYEAVVTAGEARLGALPVMHRLLAHRRGREPRSTQTLRADFPGYLDEVERIVDAVDRLAPAP
jgi:predicted nucleotidyltransferase